MPTAPRVTVLMTTYNGARYIGAAIASVLAQSFADLELIVLDDASTDDTAAVVGAIADPRIRLVRSRRNGGVVAARNAGIAFARGDCVATIDHDDLWDADKLAVQVAFLDANPGAVAVTCVARELHPGVALPRRSSRPRAADPLVLDWLLHIGNPLTYSCLVVRRAALTTLGAFMDERALYADDYDLYHRLLTLGPIVQLPVELATYRYHATNTAKHARATMQRNAADVLARSLRAQGFHRTEDWVAPSLTAHAGAGEPFRCRSDARRFLLAQDALRWHFVAHRHAGRMTDAAFARIDDGIAVCRASLFRASLRTGHLGIVLDAGRFVSRHRLSLAWATDLAGCAAVGVVRAALRLARPARPNPG